MKIDMTQLICDREGNPIPVVVRVAAGLQPDPSGALLTLSHVCATAAEAPLASDEKKTWKEKYELGVLADKVSAATCDLKAEDVATLKERIAMIYGAYVVRRAIDMLDPPPQGDAA